MSAPSADAVEVKERHLPPHAAAAEQLFLGMLMIESENWDNIMQLFLDSSKNN